MLKRPTPKFLGSTIVAVTALALTDAAALDVSVSSKDLGPFGVTNSVHLSGPIVSGDAEKVWSAIRNLDFESLDSRLHVTIDSPGGSVKEALSIGRALNALPNITNVTVTSNVGRLGGQFNEAGNCASACVLIYLGGTYRYMHPGSRLGVHQFSFDNSEEQLDSSLVTAVSQLLAADVVEYLNEVRVDTRLFSAMSNTSPSEIYWMTSEELSDYRVVNEHIYSENAEFKHVNGEYYLLLGQQSYYGENKLAAACIDGEMIFTAFLQPPDLSKAGPTARMHKLSVLADGEEFIPPWREDPQSTGRFEMASFRLDDQQTQRLSIARRIGARMMVPGADVFFGFEMELPDTKLRDVIAGCQTNVEFSARRAPSASNLMQRLPGYDFTGGDLDTRGYRGISIDACEKVCLESAQCVGISYVQSEQWCWPKKALSTPRRAAGVVSALKQ